MDPRRSLSPVRRFAFRPVIASCLLAYRPERTGRASGRRTPTSEPSTTIPGSATGRPVRTGTRPRQDSRSSSGTGKSPVRRSVAKSTCVSLTRSASIAIDPKLPSVKNGGVPTQTAQGAGTGWAHFALTHTPNHPLGEVRGISRGWRALRFRYEGVLASRVIRASLEHPVWGWKCARLRCVDYGTHH